MSAQTSPVDEIGGGHVRDAADRGLSEIEKFKMLISRERRKNAELDYFVPQDVVSNIMNPELVRKMLLETKLERYRIDDVTRAIVSGAQKTFAILIFIGYPESLLAFIEDDQMQPDSLDQKLPLQLQKLLEFLDDASAAAHFYSHQWAFIAPVFSASSLPRTLDRKTILPFMASTKIGEGGFGAVHKIQIDQSHHSFAHSGSHNFIQKELRPRSTNRYDYELELRNLSTLKLLKHPCITELLACFTYRDKYNFIFTVADGGSLADLFSGKTSSPFKKTDDILVALCGLSSAIRAVHAYHVDQFEAIGCHHDLKPSNILLDGRKLLLADFGLSRFKEQDESSASYFRGGRGDYIAPECEDLGGDFKKHAVRRSSDIWSFGCVLSDILTFMLEGSEGVQTFRTKRTFNVERVKYARFHRGPNAPNASVWDWLTQLGQDRLRHVRFLKRVISMTLKLLPDERSNITKVDTWLRFIAIDFFADQINCLFEEICNETGTMLALIERQRFQSWRSTVETFITRHSPNEDSFLSAKNYYDFEVVQSALQELIQTLRITIPEFFKSQRKVFLPIQKLNDTLYDSLPKNSQTTARMDFECCLLESKDSIQLQEFSEQFSDQPNPYSRIGLLAAVKRLKAQVETITESGESTEAIDYNSIHRNGWLQDFNIGKLQWNDNRSVTPWVLVESKNYDEEYSVDTIAQELFARLTAIVRLLNSAQLLRVLYCRGFYHHPETYSLGLVYSYPEMRPASPQQATQIPIAGTLYEILKQDFKGSRRPVLGARFRLAHSLASSLFEFHKVNWVQKAISSFNIVFFRPPSESWKDHMEQPYFMGFLCSRQDSETSFTLGPTDDTQHMNYLHPEYLATRQRFQQHYDYYSLGIVLLELGLWRTLDNISQGVAFQGSPEQLKEALLTVAAPRLGQTMGEIYQRVVEECLRWESQESEVGSSDCSSSVCLRFRELVVEALDSCRA